MPRSYKIWQKKTVRAFFFATKRRRAFVEAAFPLRKTSAPAIDLGYCGVADRWPGPYNLLKDRFVPQLPSSLRLCGVSPGVSLAWS